MPSGSRPGRSICRVEAKVRLFAMLRERAGAQELTLELPDGARVSDALRSEALAGLADGIPLVMAVNREYADGEQVLDAGDELALIPPVSGGSTAAAPWVRVSAEPLSLDALAARVRDPRAGAVVTFSGVTREVDRLEYEAYAEMAAERMESILRDCVQEHGLEAPQKEDARPGHREPREEHDSAHRAECCGQRSTAEEAPREHEEGDGDVGQSAPQRHWGPSWPR